MTHVILSDDSNIRVVDVPCRIDIISTLALTISRVNARNSLTISLFSGLSWSVCLTRLFILFLNVLLSLIFRLHYNYYVFLQ